MMKYVLPITAAASVIWTLFAFLFPSHLLGLTDFQLGEWGGKGFVIIWGIGIVLWLALKFGRAK
jgi:hypothetical protein